VERGFIEGFALRLAINIAIWIPIFVLLFNVLPRYSSRYARWLGARFPLSFAVLAGAISALLFTLITTFLGR